MKKTLFTLFLCTVSAVCLQAATVYTKVNNKPAAGWPGTYIIVYEMSDTRALVWDATPDNNNYVEATISNGTITSENLKDYHITVAQEGSNTYCVSTSEGKIGCGAKQSEILIESNCRVCTINSNGGYTMLETNTGTCRFLLYDNTMTTHRFRFYYDEKKKWEDTKKHNICFYVLGEVEQEEPQNQLDINYAQADLYACDSKFPTQSNPYFQYFYTNLRLMKQESEQVNKNNVPYVDLEIYAPNQYSIAGTYKSDQVTTITDKTNLSYWINCQAGSKHSIFYFANKSEEGWGQAAINSATMTITAKGESTQPYAYIYHIKLVFTDSNKKIWTLDKDLDVYAQWIDCDRSGNNEVDMSPVPFVLESGTHGGGTGLDTIQSDNVQGTKVLRDGQLYLMYNGRMYNVQGQLIIDN